MGINDWRPHFLFLFTKFGMNLVNVSTKFGMNLVNRKKGLTFVQTKQL